MGDRNDLDIAMLNTGHGALDHNAGALVINASRVNQAAVDSSTRRAIVGLGTCRAGVSARCADDLGDRRVRRDRARRRTAHGRTAHLGGAYARSGAAPSCVTGRDAHFNLYVTTQLTTENATDARTLADGAVERITGSARGQFNFYGPSPEPGSILRLWDFADAERILMVSKNLDPGNRIRTGRPLR
jgi:hypothetical protein